MSTQAAGSELRRRTAPQPNSARIAYEPADPDPAPELGAPLWPIPTILIFFSSIAIQGAAISYLESRQDSDMFLLTMCQILPSMGSFLIALAAMIRRTHEQWLTAFDMVLHVMSLFFGGPFSFESTNFANISEFNRGTLTLLLTSVLLRLALPCAILFFLGQMITRQPGIKPLYRSRRLVKMSSFGNGAIFWNVYLCLVGICTILKACNSEMQGNGAPRIFLTGVLITVSGGWGIWIDCSDTPLGSAKQVSYSAVMFCMIAIGVFVLPILQLGVAEKASSGLVAKNAGQMFTSLCMGPLFVHMHKFD